MSQKSFAALLRCVSHYPEEMFGTNQSFARGPKFQKSFNLGTG
jgi:hypothetical protein